MFDLDVNSLYPMVTSTFFGKPVPRKLTVYKLEPPHRHKVRVYVQGGNWWEDKEAMEAWCSERFGAHSKNYNNPRWCRDSFYFLFKNEKDATMFVLRWSV